MTSTSKGSMTTTILLIILFGIILAVSLIWMAPSKGF